MEKKDGILRRDLAWRIMMTWRYFASTMAKYEVFTTIIHWRTTVIQSTLFTTLWNIACTKPMLVSINRLSVKYSESIVKNGEFGIDYMKKNGKSVRCEFYHDGFKRKPLSRIKFNDNQPHIQITRTSLIDRIKANQCEICGSESELSMHHVKKLKDLKGKKRWEKHMIARRRKTIAVCKDCHWKIHTGRLDW